MERGRRNFLTAAAATTAAVATDAFALDKWGRDRDWTGQVTVTYPEPAWEVMDKRFSARQGNATLQRIWHGMGPEASLWHEGPCWMGDWGCFLWSDIPNHRVMRWTEDDGHVSVFQTESGYSNGHTRDREGRLIACEHDTRRVRRREHDGTWIVLMDSFNGKKLNAPNDVVVANDGAVWFTDPGYGILGPYEGHKAEFELPTRVFRFDIKTGKLSIVAEGRCAAPTAYASRLTSKESMWSTRAQPTAQTILRTSSSSMSTAAPGSAIPKCSRTSRRASPTASAAIPTGTSGAAGGGAAQTPTACG
jgi:gluconolactonase